MRYIIFCILLAGFSCMPLVAMEEKKILVAQLMEAVAIDSVVGLELVLKKGVDIDARDERGKTALMRAVVKRKEGKIFCELLAKGANVNAKDNYGKTVLDLAESAFRANAATREKRVQALLAKGAIRTEGKSERVVVPITISREEETETPKPKKKWFSLKKKKK